MKNRKDKKKCESSEKKQKNLKKEKYNKGGKARSVTQSVLGCLHIQETQTCCTKSKRGGRIDEVCKRRSSFFFFYH